MHSMIISMTYTTVLFIILLIMITKKNKSSNRQCGEYFRENLDNAIVSPDGTQLVAGTLGVAGNTAPVFGIDLANDSAKQSEKIIRIRSNNNVCGYMSTGNSDTIPWLFTGDSPNKSALPGFMGEPQKSYGFGFWYTTTGHLQLSKIVPNGQKENKNVKTDIMDVDRGSGQIRWYAPSLSTGTSLVSDKRMKENIKSYGDDCLDRVCELEVVKYNYKDNKDDEKIGFIAQDLSEKFDECVLKNGSGSLFDVNQECKKIGDTIAFENDVVVDCSCTYKFKDFNGCTYDIKLDKIDDKNYKIMSGCSEDDREMMCEGKLVDDLHSIDYNALTCMLVKSVQELKKQNEDLLARVAQLESK